MQNRIKKYTFESTIAPLFTSYIEEKRLLGYEMRGVNTYLKSFDTYLSDKDCSNGITEELIQEWIQPKPHVKAATTAHNIRILQKFLQYVALQGVHAYQIPVAMVPKANHDFEPYIFTYAEIDRIINVVDNLKYNKTSPRRHIVFPMLFRILCFCGLRISEALNLKIRDVNTEEGYLRLHETKGKYERLIPLDSKLVNHVNEYMDKMCFISTDEYFFPAPDNGRYSVVTIEAAFKEFLYKAGIPYRGRNHGPRLHDLRHTFCVHSLQKMLSDGLDHYAALPILMVYMGHRNVSATSHYIHLSAESYPEILKRVSNALGEMIPYKEASDE